MITARIASQPRPKALLPACERAAECELSNNGSLPLVDLVELYSGIEYALSATRGVVVQLISPDSDAASAEVGFQLARAGAGELGRRVLLLNHPTMDLRWNTQLPTEPLIDDGPEAPGSLKHSMVKVAGHELFLATLRPKRSKQGSLSGFDELDSQLDELRALLDMVLIIAPPADRDPFGTVMARYVDGSVLLLEAEQSRAAAAVRLREMLARSGRPIVGAVLMGRRRYIPRWLTRFL